MNQDDFIGTFFTTSSTSFPDIGDEVLIGNVDKHGEIEGIEGIVWDAHWKKSILAEDDSYNMLGMAWWKITQHLELPADFRSKA